MFSFFMKITPPLVFIKYVLYNKLYSNCIVKEVFKMIKEKNTLFTIGQFAALHEINKKTLMWYDEIGLLKPVYIKENGYRYYSYQQSAELETILMLRELDVSLSEMCIRDSSYSFLLTK